MSLEIVQTSNFKAEVKRLSKRYRSFDDDLLTFLLELKANPTQGVEVAPHIRKVRMAIHSKGKGKSGGARVITCTALVGEKDGVLGLITIYDKSDASNVKMNVILEMVKELGLR